ncbi:MAG TPA: pyridoxal-phosphate dependent enzyme, partial [Pyrinomonadaceae bacterium]|nr:pyridoxal-phosphate dependent enzyme [Pyrinomonadaceae bacterium]
MKISARLVYLVITMITLNDIRDARERIAGSATRTPLVRLNADDAPAEIYLKLENLQPIGSFKIRGAANAIARMSPETLANGVVTASAGNMAQGVAFAARRLGIPCTVIAPETAPQTKIDAIERLGGRVIKASFDDWWRAFQQRSFPG